MHIPGQISRQVLLLSLICIVIPMVVFPNLLGTSLAQPSLLFAFGELVFYAIVGLIVHRGLSAAQMAKAAGLCLVYRFVLGAVFGLTIIAAYGYGFGAAMTMGLFGYLPAIILHVAATPFVLIPVLKILNSPKVIERRVEASEAEQTPTRDSEPPTVTETVPEAPPTAEPIQPEPARESTPPVADVPPATDRVRTRGGAMDKRKDRVVQRQEPNGFDRATRYIGEHASVEVAAVVDQEGLTLSQFGRGDAEPERWAPYALLFVESNAGVLRRARWENPERIDISLADRRIVVANEGGISLLVVADRHSDDLLNIRINQGLETIRKYVAERYGQKLYANAEYTHV